MRGKRGISIVVGYVLLIIIAIALALLIYAWLKGLLPGQVEQCPDEVSLYVSNYYCQNNRLTLTLKNQGLFNLYGFILRVSNTTQGFFYDVKSNEGYIEHYFSELENNVLKPNEETTKIFSYAEYNEIKRIEIEPFILNEKEEIVLCENAVIRQKIEGCELLVCDCTNWENQDCGLGDCANDQMYQTRICNPAGCASESRCIYDVNCGNKIKIYVANMTGGGAWTGSDTERPPDTFQFDRQGSSDYVSADYVSASDDIKLNATTYDFGPGAYDVPGVRVCFKIEEKIGSIKNILILVEGFAYESKDDDYDTFLHAWNFTASTWEVNGTYTYLDHHDVDGTDQDLTAIITDVNNYINSSGHFCIIQNSGTLYNPYGEENQVSYSVVDYAEIKVVYT